MSFSNSPLVSCTRLSPNHSGQRTHSIDRITPHCVVGQVTVESLGEIFSVSTRQASCNYGIGRDGRVVLVVEEKNRSWCSSNAENDQRAVTIEGNTGDQVARRRYSIYDSAILGYGRPAYDEEKPTTAPTPTSAAQEKVQYYRVRKSWPEKSSQIGAFTRLENAKLMVDANPGYAAFDEEGQIIYPPVDNAQ